MDNKELIESSEGLIRKIAWDYMKCIVDDRRGMVTYEDLFSAGYEGLLEAAQRYDAKKKVKFSTYAYSWIKNAILKELLFYFDKDALLIDPEEWDRYAPSGNRVEDEAMSGFDISSISVADQVRIISKKLSDHGLSEDEIEVYLAINGIGCDRVTNLYYLARKMGKSEIEIRYIKQRALDKLKKLTL
ncbi:MAG: sigma-70 family RNA polymerase sigma factor [Lachnospiraceae bacterium]|nr:sigma-70 family RNA polymerase sigma factor [Lachnospiraceae bacterium]